MPAIHLQGALNGFIASAPRLTTTENGDSRFLARIGQEHQVRQADGTFAKAETTFHDLAIYGKTAQRAFEQFKKGDQFIAQGYMRTYQATGIGGPEIREEFVATRIGHDLATTKYTVDHTRQHTPAAGLRPVSSSAARPVMSL
ncbi:MAG: single-stranded DNA-binding protein [Propionibacteriaceae bacterium]|jgi:single-stranded DNA-binding protein|nr:single-stranded DNA-binding protein [Propionibacteriaceae bacterium]